MEISEETGTGQYRITGVDADCIIINQQPYTQSLILMSNHLIPSWRPQHIDDLRVDDWALLDDFELEVVLLGTGPQCVFPHPEITAPLVARQLGFEVMDTATVCRTYNILMAEERLVAAALIV